MWSSCLQNNPSLHLHTISNLQSCCWTWSYSAYLLPRRWQWTPLGSHKGCLLVTRRVKDMTDNQAHTPQLGMLQENTHHSVHPATVAVMMSHCSELGTCKVKCVFWLIDYLIETWSTTLEFISRRLVFVSNSQVRFLFAFIADDYLCKLVACDWCRWRFPYSVNVLQLYGLKTTSKQNWKSQW